jgi:hypothetical protein
VVRQARSKIVKLSVRKAALFRAKRFSIGFHQRLVPNFFVDALFHLFKRLAVPAKDLSFVALAEIVKVVDCHLGVKNEAGHNFVERACNVHGLLARHSGAPAVEVEFQVICCHSNVKAEFKL